MKIKSFAMLAMPVLLAASFSYMTPALADDDIDAINTNTSMQNPTLADGSSMQNQDNNNASSNNSNGSDNTSSSSNNDEGSPDTASSTGDDDY